MATATKKRTSRSRHQLRTRCPLVTMGKPMLGDDGWIIVNADTPLYISITPEMAKHSVVRSGSYCVVARALDKAFGSHYKYVVGAGVIKIIDEVHKVLVRVTPTGPLKTAIKKFDMSLKRGKQPRWDLPANLYRLAPLPKSWRAMYEDPAQYAKTRKKRQAHKAAAKTKRAGVGGTFVAVSGAHTPRKTARARTRAAVTRVIMRHRGTGKKLVRV